MVQLDRLSIGNFISSIRTHYNQKACLLIIFAFIRVKKDILVTDWSFYLADIQKTGQWRIDYCATGSDL